MITKVTEQIIITDEPRTDSTYRKPIYTLQIRH